MPKFEVPDVEIEFECARCGADLAVAPPNRPSGSATVEPCKHCLEAERDKGYEEGQVDAG